MISNNGIDIYDGKSITIGQLYQDSVISLKQDSITSHNIYYGATGAKLSVENIKEHITNLMEEAETVWKESNEDSDEAYGRYSAYKELLSMLKDNGS